MFVLIDNVSRAMKAALDVPSDSILTSLHNEMKTKVSFIFAVLRITCIPHYVSHVHHTPYHTYTTLRNMDGSYCLDAL